MKKSELIEDVAISALVTKKVANRVVEETFNVIIEAIKRGEDVLVPNFGTFKPTIRRGGIFKTTIQGKKIERVVPESTSFRLKVYPKVKRALNAKS